jgi:hypothetical protein
VTFQHILQISKGFNLNLPYPFPGHAEFRANLLQRQATITMQAEPAFDNFALPSSQTK